MLPQETHHHLLLRIHFETRTRREKKAPHAPIDLWLTRRCLAWSFLCIAVCYSRWMWRSKPGQQKEMIQWTRSHACVVHTTEKSSSTTKWPRSSPPKFSRDILGGKQPSSRRLYARNLMILLSSEGQPITVSACENITSSVNFLFREKANCQNGQKLGFFG